MDEDLHDEHAPLWEVIAWCLFALVSLSAFAFLVMLLFR